MYRIIDRLFRQFEQLHPERYKKCHGSWRHVIGDMVRKLLADIRRGIDVGQEIMDADACKIRYRIKCQLKLPPTV